MKLKSARKTSAKSVIAFLALTVLIAVAIIANQPAHTSASGSINTNIFLPIIQHNADHSLGIPIFGVQMYSDTRTTSRYYDSLINSNASWVRTNISWSAVEPTNTSPDNYYWATVDNSLSVSVHPDITNMRIS